MVIDNIKLRRQDYEILLEQTIKKQNNTQDKKVYEWLELEINFIVDQIKLLKKWEKIINKYKELR